MKQFSSSDLQEIIESELEFFKKPYVFTSEADTLFSISESDQSKISILSTESNPNPIKPHFTPASMALRSAFKPDFETITFTDNDPFDLDLSITNPYFALLKRKGPKKDKKGRTWLFVTDSSTFLFDEINDQITQVQHPEQIILVDGKLNIDGMLYSFQVNQTQNTDSKAIDYTPIFSFWEAVHSDPQPQISYKYFADALKLFNGYPPVTEATLPLYQPIVSNPQFLDLFDSFQYQVSDPSIAYAWFSAANRYSRTLIPMHIFILMQSTAGENSVFRSNTFVTYFLKYALLLDENWKNFTETFSPSKESIISDFLVSFESLQFSPFSLFILHSIYFILSFMFESPQAKYNGVSGILFLRGLIPGLYERLLPSQADLRDEFKNTINRLNAVMNFQKEICDPNHVERLKQLIDRYKDFPQNCKVDVTVFQSLETVKVLIDKFCLKPNAFTELFKRKTFAQRFNEYKEQILSASAK